MYVVNVKGKIVVFSVMSVMLMFALLVLPSFADGIYIRWIKPPEGYPGTSVYVVGGGATPNGTVVAWFSGPINATLVENATVGRTIADGAGYWELTFIVPEVPPGNYTVRVVDNETLTSDTIGFGVLAYHAIKIGSVFPTAGTVGTIVYVSGGGATPKGLVMLYFDHRNVANTTAEDWGGWEASFQVPDVPPGNYTITALDVTSNTTDTAWFTVTRPPTIYVSPQEAPVGSKIIINGEGFSPRTGIYIMFEDMLFFTPVYTDENGEFNVSIFVPIVNSGNYTIKAMSVYYYGEGPKVLADASFTVTMGFDTLFQAVNETQNNLDTLNKILNATQNAINQTQNSANATYNEASSANQTASAAKEAAESALEMANEARTYAMAAMIFAIITAALSATILFKKK